PQGRIFYLGQNASLTVGAGLPAIAVYQLMQLLLTHRYRRQAGSYSGAAPSSVQRHQRHTLFDLLPKRLV
ncbi:hypothetical protein ACJEBJ_29500, partial [Pseudomonas pergaminensis]